MLYCCISLNSWSCNKSFSAYFICTFQVLIFVPAWDFINWRRQRCEVRCGGATFIEEVHIADRIWAEIRNKKLFKNEAKDFSSFPVYMN